MRRFITGLWSSIRTALLVIPAFAIVLGAALWLESRQTSAEPHIVSVAGIAIDTGIAPPAPSAPPVRGLFQSPPAPPAKPPAQPPAPGVGKSPPAAPSPQAPGKPAATPIPDEVVLDLANNPVFIGLALLVVLAVLGGFIWFWTAQNRR